MKEKKYDDDTIISLPSDEFSPVTLHSTTTKKKYEKNSILKLKKGKNFFRK